MKDPCGPVFLAAACLLAAPSLRVAGQPAPAPAVKLERAAIAREAKNDQREMLVPEAGKQFLWVTAKISGAPRSVDLAKVVLAGGGQKFPLLGVDSAFGGDPNQFSMIAPARGKDGKMNEPLEETRSVGSVAFAFSPGKGATLKVITPPEAVCLLFAVPQGFKAGEIVGLDAAPLPLPALSAPAR